MTTSWAVFISVNPQGINKSPGASAEETTDAPHRVLFLRNSGAAALNMFTHDG